MRYQSRQQPPYALYSLTQEMNELTLDYYLLSSNGHNITYSSTPSKLDGHHAVLENL